MKVRLSIPHEVRYHGAAAESDFRRFLRTLPRAEGRDKARCTGNVAFGKGNVVALCKAYFPEALEKRGGRSWLVNF